MLQSYGSDFEEFPVIYVHHGASGDVVYADRPVLIVHVDEGQSQDRVFVRVAAEPPSELIHGPINCTNHGSADEVRRKHALVAWLKGISAILSPASGPGSVD